MLRPVSFRRQVSDSLARHHLGSQTVRWDNRRVHLRTLYKERTTCHTETFIARAVHNDPFLGRSPVNRWRSLHVHVVRAAGGDPPHTTWHSVRT